MIKRMLRKGSEQIVRQFEYYRAAIEQEQNSRATLRHRRPINQLHRGSRVERDSHFQYPGPPSFHSDVSPPSSSSYSHNSYSTYHPNTIDPAHNHRHTPTYAQSHSHVGPSPSVQPGMWDANGLSINPQLTVHASWSSSDYSNSSTKTLMEPETYV